MYTLNELNSFIEKGLFSLKFNEPPKELYQPIEYMISIGGKRLRPLTCLMTYSLFSKTIDKQILYPAMALEIFHGFTLIHDDIMDNAAIRRGQATVYKKWNTNIGILSGDVMSIKAYELLSVANTNYLPDTLQLFTKTAVQVCEGQQYDMNFENIPFITMDDYIKMIGLKTAVLIACSAKMGALLAGADKKTCEALYQYAYNLGIAFQIQDDYLDSFGDSSIFGKKIGGDILNNKKTWLLVDTFKEASGEDKEMLNKILSYKEDMAEEKIAFMKALYKKLSVDKRAIEATEYYNRLALEQIDKVAFSPAQLEQLQLFANMLLKREK